MSPATSYLLGALGPLALKTVLYFMLFRFRRISATLLTCIVISGAGFLVFIPMPQMLSTIAGIGVAIWLCQYFTEVEPYPDGILIPVGVEIFSLALFRYVVPLFTA